MTDYTEWTYPIKDICSFEDIGTIYRSIYAHIVKFIASWITFSTTLSSRSGKVILAKAYLLKWLGCSLGHRLGRRL